MACAALAVAGLTVGCEKKVTPYDVRSDMTPALDTVARTWQQDMNLRAKNVDHTTRQFWNDIRDIWLLDEPIHLTEYPIP